MEEERSAVLNRLKKTVFYDLLNLAGRVFIVVRHSENVMIGSRGFRPEEKEQGLVLVFNARMNFTWNDAGIEAHLVFGTSPEKCFIPEDDIIAVYSPELETQLLTAPVTPQTSREEPPRAAGTSGGDGEKENVVKVDFKKKRR